MPTRESQHLMKSMADKAWKVFRQELILSVEEWLLEKRCPATARLCFPVVLIPKAILDEIAGSFRTCESLSYAWALDRLYLYNDSCSDSSRGISWTWKERATVSWSVPRNILKLKHNSILNLDERKRGRRLWRPILRLGKWFDSRLNKRTVAKISLEIHIQ